MLRRAMLFLALAAMTILMPAFGQVEPPLAAPDAPGMDPALSSTPGPACLAGAQESLGLPEISPASHDPNGLRCTTVTCPPPFFCCGPYWHDGCCA